ncbi:hypothetical protein IM816_08860 [Luteibacter flocculans]|uniref:Uncharacterized protein n=1 Tax=Luteibacter flocculans TaxID=2780091 RepID=A0ABY4T5I7_9GAMM|nr:hypothetical protein [Luteibacter flocculans]URL60168.1 hypothetical protein IM816_08860 [Luteibacter flocculans]
MPRRQWQLEDGALVHPTGRRIPLDDIEDWFRAAWGGNQSIQTDRWRGWRIVQQYLVPPGRSIRDGIHINCLRALANHLGVDGKRS